MYANVNNNENGHVNNGDSSSSSSQVAGLKKGPWSAAEDAILMEYVKKNGEGNWNAVQRNTGLMRCGKSCRLRWANHLRPNLKKGGFSPEEERIIIELHAKLGNKWARMAAQLPGRTDNEIKNFWNTRMKRRQRAGLPLYPQENREGTSTIHKFNQENDHQQISQPAKFCTPNPSGLSSFLTSTPCLPLFHPNNFSPFTASKFQLMQDFHYSSFGDDTINGVNINGLALPKSISTLSPYSGSSPSLSSTPIYNQSLGIQATTSTSPIPMVDSENNDDHELENNHMSFTSMIMGAHTEPFGLAVPGLIKSELPSNQNFMSYSMSPASISTSACGLEASSGEVNYNGGGDQNCEPGILLTSEDRRNSGLLDALLVEAKSLSCRQVKPSNPDHQWSNKVAPIDHKGKCEVDGSDDDEEEEEEGKRAGKRIKFSLKNGSEISDENQSYVGSSQSSIDNYGNRGLKLSEGQVQEVNSVDEDLMSLLNNFPASMPVVPDWYTRRINGANFESSSGDENTGINVDQNASLTQATNQDGTPSVRSAFVSCHWSNMPGIC